MKKAVLLKCQDRFESFRKELESNKVHYTILDFDAHDWVDYDYSDVNFVIFFPHFKFPNHPLSLYQAHDNLTMLKIRYPHLKIFPEPNLALYYNDKYRQYLFLHMHHFPIPDTIPLFTESSLTIAEEKFGFPMVLKNRFGAGGEMVFKVHSRSELELFYDLSTMNFFKLKTAKHLLKQFFTRRSLYYLIKVKKAIYPFYSPPLLAQRFVKTDRDVRVVVCNGKTVEAHWRRTAGNGQWKVNIDGGGIGEWSKIPQDVLDVSEKLSRDLKASWIALDILWREDSFFITEFSPVWHHYAYKEKPSFVYKDDYNISTPLDAALNLERLIVNSLMQD